jgi:1,2-diacylglycerol 3-beta-galactosyltransferase
VSLIPHYNRALWEALQHACPSVPFVTLLTDIADYPPHFWIEKLDQWVICGSTRAFQQAREIGIPSKRVLKTSGMILSPRFYETMQVDRAAERLRLGLKPDVPVGLVLFGGEGSTEMVKIAKALNESESNLQLILICGKNEAVAGELRAIEKQIPMVVEGFTKEIPLYMEISDFFIGKPGPGSLSEAFAKKLPVIVQRNAWTMAHERYNTEWIEELGAGIVIESFGRDLPDAVKQLLDPVHYEQYRERAASTRNMAVFEIPDMLSDILAKPSSGRLLDGASDYAAQSHPKNAHSV